MLPAKAHRTLLITQLGAYTFQKKDDPRKLVDPIFATKVLKYLEPEGEKQKNKKKAGAGELFASLTPAKLAQNRPFALRGM